MLDHHLLQLKNICETGVRVLEVLYYTNWQTGSNYSTLTSKSAYHNNCITCFDL